VRRCEGPHPLVVGVQDRGSAGFESFNEFALGARHALNPVSEVLHVRISDVRDNADLRPRDLHQRCNLTGVIHARFQHAHLRIVRQPENRQRQSDMVVEIAHRAAGRQR
jgi:hypothetical protein